MTQISLIVQSRGDLSNLQNIIKCYQKQLLRERELILVIDQIFTAESYKDRLNELTDNNDELLFNENIHIYCNLNAQFTHNNVSALRNFGIEKAYGAMINLMDDDEDFHSDYLVKSLEYRRKYKNIISKDIILTPTLMYRHTDKVQNYGFSGFNFLLSRPIKCKLKKHDFASIQMYSGNSLFGPAYIFNQIKMDERFDFVYEDLDYSYSIQEAGFPIIVVKNLKIYHMEKNKTILENAWIGNINQAYKKAKHRILFVRKHANIFQKIQFFLIGLRGQPLWLILKVFIFAKQKDWKPIIKAIYRGTIDGFQNSQL